MTGDESAAGLFDVGSVVAGAGFAVADGTVFDVAGAVFLSLSEAALGAVAAVVLFADAAVPGVADSLVGADVFAAVVAVVFAVVLALPADVFATVVGRERVASVFFVSGMVVLALVLELEEVVFAEFSAASLDGFAAALPPFTGTFPSFEFVAFRAFCAFLAASNVMTSC